MTQSVSNDVNQDPFAAASQATPSAPAPDPNADPFASPDEVGAGGPRRPSFEEMVYRVVVMKPQGWEMVPANPMFNQPAGTMVKRYTVELTVLGSEKLKVYDPNLNGKDQGGFIEFDCPFTWKGFYVSQVGIVMKLDGLPEAKPFLLGVVRRCPTGAGYRKGETPDDIEARWTAYVAAGKPDRMKPQFSWGLVDTAPQERALALAWYRGQ